MEEEVSQKTIALVINTSKLTANELRHAMARKLQDDRHRHSQKVQQRKMPKQKSGKMKVKELVASGGGVSNIEITQKNIKAFEKSARRYGVDFALKKDTSKNPPRYLVFFRGRDTDVINQAFKEFLNKEVKQKKPSIRSRMEEKIEQVAKQVIKSRSKSQSVER